VLKYCQDPNFRAVFIRETNGQLSQSGGLFEEARVMWEKHFGAKFKTHPSMMATFPSGATVQFKVCGSDRDVSNYDGGQYSLVVFDEAQNHTEVQIRYLESRIRSRAKGPHQLILTCNPKYDHDYLLKFVTPYLDPETGIPRKEMFAREMYYGAYNGQVVVGTSQAELEEKYPGISCQTYTFIAATVYDNPRMRKINPTYVTRLENLKRVERERLLLGSWTAKPQNQGLFKREWCNMIDEVPNDVVDRVRGYDLAATLPSETYPDPDWTACVRMSKTKSGRYVVEHACRTRQLAHGVLDYIEKNYFDDLNDGVAATVWLEVDPGSSGKHAAGFMVQYLVEHGVDVRKQDVNPSNGKLARCRPFLSLCEAGSVDVVKGDWNEMWFNEMEDFIEGNRRQKDDLFDSTASSCKALMKNRTIPTFSIPISTQPSVIPTLS
jgi:predicted phage terminase large subunit-like protein